MDGCKHKEWTEKKRCGFTDKRKYYQHCKKCGQMRFGMDYSKKSRERLNAK